MIGRRAFLGSLAGGLLAAPLAAEAQPARVSRIGVLSPGSPGTSPLLDAFRQGLRELGYVEGQHIRLEYRFAETKLERLPGLAAELVDLKVDVIFAINSTAARAALNAAKTIPIVFTWVADPLSLVTNLARPGGNITGLTTITNELSGKRVDLLKGVLPGISRIAVLWNSANPVATRTFKEMEEAGARLGVRIYPVSVRGSSELQDAFNAAGRARAGALFVIEEGTLLPHRARILSLAAQHRLPAASQFREFAEAGGLLSYGPNLAELFRRAATYVDKILKGAKPGDLPVEQPTKFELVINLKTAKALGLTIPPSLLQRADEIIQ
jgi:putative tryptophan/tyrosine transport system substrate-binding protein